MMKQININHTLTGTYSEGFCEMTAQELRKFYASEKSRCGLYDKDRHIIISVCWKKQGILGFLTDTRSVLKGAEMRLSHNLSRYRLIERLNREIMSCPAEGIRFEYQVTGTDIIQYSDLYVFKYGDLYYSAEVVARKEGFEESQREMEGFLRSFAAMR